jgi:hypothetical protein
MEFAVLILGGNIVSYLGISWGNVLIAIIGMVGVEVCLRMVNYCGDRLLSREEREFMKALKASARNVSVSLE